MEILIGCCAGLVGIVLGVVGVYIYVLWTWRDSSMGF